MAQHEERPYGDAHGYDHAHDHHGHGHAQVPYDQAQVEREVTEDRQWMFDKFIQWSFWITLHIFVILALLALTQT